MKQNPFIHIEMDSETNEIKIETNVPSVSAITLLARTTEEVAYSMMRDEAAKQEEEKSTVQ